MADLIDRAALIEKRVPKEKTSNLVCQMVRLQDVLDAPTIEAKPVVHGEWESSPHLYGYVRCSECHDCNVWGEWIDGKKWNYCPNCGADMRERKENDN